MPTNQMVSEAASPKAALNPDMLKLLSVAAQKLKDSGKTLDDAAPKHHAADVIYHGDKLTLPEGMTIPEAILLLYRRMEYENQQTEVTARFEYSPFDCAHALYEVMRRKFGWVSMEAIPSFFGDQLPQMIEIPVAVGRVVSVPWGRIQLFKNEGFIQTEMQQVGPRQWAFFLKATVLRKHEATVKAIYEEVRRELENNSIYRGKAVSAQFTDGMGTPLAIPTISFVDVFGAHKSQLIFSQEVADAIETNLFMPIERMKDIEACGMPAKYGVLLAGPFGVGKTLAARVAANLAVKNGITFIYCKSASELRDALAFAQQYQPACVFCEDIDRTLSGERTGEMDSVLNIIDGIDTKRAKIVTILTTNDVDSINPATVRPGRLDAVVDVTAPDSEAVEKLIRMYGGGELDPTIDLREISMKLRGNIPAIIEEVVKRAKRSALRRTAPGETNIIVGTEALMEAANTMTMQLRLLNPAPKRTDKSIEAKLADAVREGVRQYHEE
jgi:transitional endoplasmic reticulum ATPase